MTALLSMGALVIDFGAIYAERAQLQNGADAAALAIAQRCADNDCGDVAAQAQEFADANAHDGAAEVTEVDAGAGQVSVRLATRTSDGGQGIRHWLAPIFGIEETTVQASSRAVWGGPSGGLSQLPLAMSWCTFAAQTGGGVPPPEPTEVTIYYLDGTDEDCMSPSGHTIPGGFGWLSPEQASCTAVSDIQTGQVPGKPGVSVPDECGPADFQALQNTTVLIPVFEESGGSGSSGWFKIHGYAAFHITGYRFHCPAGYRWNDGNSACGSNTERFISGYFTQFVAPDDAFQYGGPDLGGRVIALASEESS